MGVIQIKPTESELEVLQILWSKGPSTVRQVNNLLKRSKDVGYTTTLKIMQIMNEKGLVERETDSRTHIYSAGVSREDTQNLLLNRFLENTFKGSASSLVMQALGNHHASASELKEIKDLIEKLEKNNGNSK
jgi:predicted transcriptional regulator